MQGEAARKLRASPRKGLSRGAGRGEAPRAFEEGLEPGGVRSGPGGFVEGSRGVPRG